MECSRYKLFIVVALFKLTLIPSADFSTITHAENLHSALLIGYNKDVRPIDNQSAPLVVEASTYLRSIQDLDEITGELTFTGAIGLNWYDSKMIWTPSSYGDIYKIYIDYNSVWVPEIIITTTTDDSDTMAKKWQKVKFEEDGLATMVVGDRIKGACSVNVEKYPFDKQSCSVRFTFWGYDITDVNVIAASPTLNTEQYSGNSIWHLASSSTSTYNLDGWACYEITFNLERKSSFTIVNLVMPLLLMSLLNVLVFVLVPDSGERVSFSITVLLAIAVFMTIISDSLPASSEPVPIITYKLMTDMFLSGFITLVTILNLRLFHADEGKPVPRCLQCIYRFLRCKKLPKNSGKVKNATVAFANDVKQNKESRNMKVDEELQSCLKQNVTWKDISYLVDSISFVVFTLASVLSFVIYIVTASS